MKTVLALIVLGTLTVALAGELPSDQKTAEVQPATIRLQTTCPVMGGKINQNLYVDYAGQRVYVCCEACIEVLTKDPEKYIKKLEADGVTVAKIQTICPVMGGKINQALYIDHSGKRVYVCCEACLAAVTKDPEKYIKQLEADGVVLAPIPKETQAETEAEGKRNGQQGHQH